MAIAAALLAGLATAGVSYRARLDRSIVLGWSLVAAIVCGSIVHTLVAPDERLATIEMTVPDFSVPADVSGLQGTSSLDAATKSPGGVVVSGWIFDERTHGAGDAMYLDVDGVTRIEGTYGEARADVAAAFHTATAERVGFRVTIAPGVLAPGEHRARLGLRVGSERFESVRRYALPVLP